MIIKIIKAIILMQRTKYKLGDNRKSPQMLSLHTSPYFATLHMDKITSSPPTKKAALRPKHKQKQKPQLQTQYSPTHRTFAQKFSFSLLKKLSSIQEQLADADRSDAGGSIKYKTARGGLYRNKSINSNYEGAGDGGNRRGRNGGYRRGSRFEEQFRIGDLYGYQDHNHAKINQLDDQKDVYKIQKSNQKYRINKYVQKLHQDKNRDNKQQQGNKQKFRINAKDLIFPVQKLSPLDIIKGRQKDTDPENKHTNSKSLNNIITNSITNSKELTSNECNHRQKNEKQRDISQMHQQRIKQDITNGQNQEQIQNQIDGEDVNDWLYRQIVGEEVYGFWDD